MNMTYCRFQNTLSDLRDCRNNIEGPLPQDEAEARASLIELAFEIARDFLNADRDDVDIAKVDLLNACNEGCYNCVGGVCEGTKCTDDEHLCFNCRESGASIAV